MAHIILFAHHGWMVDVLLYPTETLYALGVDALDKRAVAALAKLKGRGPEKTASWLVRSVADIERYAELDAQARRIAETLLPGPLTLVLRARSDVPRDVVASDGTIGFRISRDAKAQSIIEEHMGAHNTPLTCTSANISGSPTLSTPAEILQQFGKRAARITSIVDDGSRKSLASTVVRVADGTITVVREGEVSEKQIRSAAQLS